MGRWDEEHSSHFRPGQEIFMGNNGLKRLLWVFLGGPAVKTPGCQRRGPRFDPWLGELITSHILCSTAKIFLIKKEKRDRELGWQHYPVAKVKANQMPPQQMNG